ncbi:MAG: SpoIIE family protein phosphatase [Gemmatimonadales bacterium]|nr:SpoIIE family protein phosphatase [Gemmatimonadales bacterium]NIN13501.1 SpoIIE family protein phosphatase [Gemmatimonadales bacterium]NIN51493.1 SpoIIE family protein phosphatase [Gemmatimonadales bacterium]NIP08957.1 SpoIIE family protein phosphatase [Gemmatimonadales bacterium]NIR03635.1 SpoIIE family protein phosphatase [Gemmatimonadales bacterium]
MLTFDGVQVDCHGSTDVGKVREVNQDQYLIASLHKVIEVHATSIPGSYRRLFDSGARALLLLVADGVGGAARGEEASSLTLDTITTYVTNSMRCFYKLDEQIPEDLLEELAVLVQQSHATVRSQAEQAPDRAGMATTLTMAHILWPRAYVVQIGDSRCYRIRDTTIVQVTKDQTVVQYLVDEGALTPDEAAESPYGNILSQAIGAGEQEVHPEISRVELEKGDVLLLCTDGLTAHVMDNEIADYVRAASSAKEASEHLVQAALDAGGSDNVTVVVSRFG